MGMGRLEQLGIIPLTVWVKDDLVPHEIVEEEERNLTEMALANNDFDGLFELNYGDEVL
jgi:hypothetical protein